MRYQHTERRRARCRERVCERALARPGVTDGDPPLAPRTSVRQTAIVRALANHRASFALVWILTGCGLVLDLDPQVQDGFDARPPDAPPSAGDGCAAQPEDCNSRDDDCDGAVDEDFDLASDPRHCGACGVACPNAGGAPAPCVLGACEAPCPPDTGECDGDTSTGCETDLTRPTSCGACESVCSPPAACGPTPSGYACVGGCEASLTACDGTCVDLTTSTDHCGGCGNACLDDDHGEIACVAGECVVVECGDFFDDCNGVAADGCETDLSTAMLSCGACGAACNDGQVCAGGTCVGA